MKLLDVNVWLAASWARHRHQEVAKGWLDQQEDELTFCRVTQMALLRFITNAAITGRDALSAVRHAVGIHPAAAVLGGRTVPAPGVGCAR
jgi:predicted nucleic acid-binding protein